MMAKEDEMMIIVINSPTTTDCLSTISWRVPCSYSRWTSCQRLSSSRDWTRASTRVWGAVSDRDRASDVTESNNMCPLWRCVRISPPALLGIMIDPINTGN